MTNPNFHHDILAALRKNGAEPEEFTALDDSDWTAHYAQVQQVWLALADYHDTRGEPQFLSGWDTMLEQPNPDGWIITATLPSQGPHRDQPTLGYWGDIADTTDDGEADGVDQAVAIAA